MAFSQSYSIVPNDSINLIGTLEDLQTLSIQQVNISTDTLQLKWKKVYESVPLFWEAIVCDNQNCYTSLLDSGMMNPVVPGDYGFILLHITPHTNYGTAVVQYAVWDTANALVKDTLTFVHTVNNTSSIADLENPNVFHIFPNPAKDFININSTFSEKYSIEIFNALGKFVYTENCNSTCALPIANWDAGVYSISIVVNNRIYQTKQLLIQK